MRLNSLPRRTGIQATDLARIQVAHADLQSAVKAIGNPSSIDGFSQVGPRLAKLKIMVDALEQLDARDVTEVQLTQIAEQVALVDWAMSGLDDPALFVDHAAVSAAKEAAKQLRGAAKDACRTPARSIGVGD